MARLTEEGFWDQAYRARVAGGQSDSGRTLKARLKRLLGKKLNEYMRDYDDYLLWEVIYKAHLPKVAGAKVLEVGSAPGEYLVRLNKTYGYIPYGVEYTINGAELNRQVFASNGLDPANVIHQDFFSQGFQTQYKERFDVVVSRGFIEHFDDVRDAVAKHFNLLKPGGYLVIDVPNFRGIYYPWVRLFRKKVLEMHNLRIMRKKEFVQVFAGLPLHPLFCGHYGTFSFNLLYAPPRSPLRFVLAVLHLLQRPLNVVFRSLFKHGGIESGLTSPFLLFIGVRRSQDEEQAEGEPSAHLCAAEGSDLGPVQTSRQ